MPNYDTIKYCINVNMRLNLIYYACLVDTPKIINVRLPIIIKYLRGDRIQVHLTDIWKIPI